MTEQNQGPYFEGQMSQQCGHYFPDVLRLKDVRRGDDCFRVLNCRYCGNYEEEINLERFSSEIIPVGTLDFIRNEEMAKILAEQ